MANKKYIKEDIPNLEQVDNLQPIEDINMASIQQTSKRVSDEIEDRLKKADRLPRLDRVFLGADKQPVPDDPVEPKITLDESLFNDSKEDLNESAASVAIKSAKFVASNWDEITKALKVAGVAATTIYEVINKLKDLKNDYFAEKSIEESAAIEMKAIVGDEKDRNETYALAGSYVGPVKYKGYDIMSSDKGKSYRIMKGDHTEKSGFGSLVDAKRWIIKYGNKK